LEAKRLLAHSLFPVANIGYEIGFSEPTNFVKFFRRETRLTPGAFRSQLSSRKPDPVQNRNKYVIR
jgi:AraC-like DNA-binding protein